MPPAEPLGRRSRIVAFHASLVPVFCTLRPNWPDCPTLIVAGPDFVSTRFGVRLGIPPTSTEALALAVCGGLFHVTTAVLVRFVPLGSPAAIRTRNRKSKDCPGCNGPWV